MTINPLTIDLINQLSGEARRPGLQGAAGSDPALFSNMLTEAFANVAATDAADKTSGLALLTGRADDMAGILIDAQKAELSLSLALQIRNKFLDAYNEIMKMQV